MADGCDDLSGIDRVRESICGLDWTGKVIGKAYYVALAIWN